MDAARLLGTIAFWWIFLMFIENAFNALALPTITTFINAILAYLPRVFAAILIVFFGALIANVVAGAIRRATAETGLTTSGVLGTLAKWFILLFAFLTADVAHAAYGEGQGRLAEARDGGAQTGGQRRHAGRLFRQPAPRADQSSASQRSRVVRRR
jgi:hypothetical protein